MIHDGQELQAMQERIAYFQRVLAQLRVTATPQDSLSWLVAIEQRSSRCKTGGWHI